MPAPDYQTCYEFERLLSVTLAALFNRNELKPKAISDTPELQSDRPRVEVVVTQGASLGRHYILDAQGQRRENGWHGVMTLAVITSADIGIHSAYLGAVRNLAATLDRLDLSDEALTATPDPPGPDDPNPPTAFPLLYHEISQITVGGSAHNWKPEAGYYETQLNYDFIFAIRADAWPGGLNQS